MKFNPYIVLLLAFLTLFSAPSSNAVENGTNSPFIKISKAPELQLPLNCTLGSDCWVINYVDMIADDGQNLDHSCGARTYDGHKGTDFAVLDGVAMAEGVPVLSVKDGTIKRVRDNQPDRWASPEDIEQVKLDRKECGNAVLIDHGNGLETIYCHMRQGSVTVKAGQKVKAGDQIGQVGLSGFTQFPHVHLGVMQDGKILDPFTGLTHDQNCGKSKARLWDKDVQIKYQPMVILATGLQNTVPDLKTLEKDITPPKSIKPDTELLAGWGMLYGVRTGDVITMKIFDPNNKLINSHEIIQEKERARQFYYTGKKLKGVPLAEGVYTITTTLTRPATDKNVEQRIDKTANLLVVR